MAKLPYVDLAAAPDAVRVTLERLPVRLNIFRMMAHAQTNLRPLLRLGTSILSEQRLDGKLRELAILRVAQLSPARYEWVQHVPIARAFGASPVQIEALERGDIDADCFDAAERLVLRFTTELIGAVRPSDPVFEDLANAFTPQEIVELILAIGFYMTMARLMETTGIDLEPDAGTKLIDAMRQPGAK